ncbi:DUF2332 domain-containing protein [Oceanicella actignis]|uniref:DUF2332 domain-containing protein n=1 Tax=Oceanicella actignis TaxID=1189325 RepID=UPI0011E8436F|nr:DUF2332 family protein [Oceanicella actignis]TYO89585.1 hypothetical protein LY05_01574 [Oceanicella actignis]
MPAPAPLPAVAEAFARQAEACAAMGSDFTARLCAALPEALPADAAFGARVLRWPGDPWKDALALRVCGALHALARSGAAPELTEAWPPRLRADPIAAAARAIRAHDARLLPWLDSPPQTNETARASALLGGALHLAAQLRMPLEILELGASAGLNMAFDLYRHELGEAGAWGDARAPVRLSCAWRGPPPPLDAPLEIAARAGVDLRPADPARPEDRERLLAYVWPDQAERLARAEAALDFAAAQPWRVEKGEAAAWLDARLNAPPAPGRARVVMHSIVWPYLPPDSRARIRAAMARAGARAASDAPLAWLRMEPDDVPGSAALTLRVWPDGRSRVLGRADFHGRWVAWEGGA